MQIGVSPTVSDSTPEGLKSGPYTLKSGKIVIHLMSLLSHTGLTISPKNSVSILSARTTKTIVHHKVAAHIGMCLLRARCSSCHRTSPTPAPTTTSPTINNIHMPNTVTAAPQTNLPTLLLLLIPWLQVMHVCTIWINEQAPNWYMMVRMFPCPLIS